MRVGKVILALSMVVLLLLVGCVGYSEPALPPANSTLPYVPSGDEPPADRTWISPGKVNVANFYPGGRAEYPITIHNGKDTTASFLVSYRYPDHVGEGYVKPTPEAQDWVIIADSTPVLMPKETRDILVVLAIPNGAKVFAPKWEFWISVIDTTQVGTVRAELCSRWLVSMR